MCITPHVLLTIFHDIHQVHLKKYIYKYTKYSQWQAGVASIFGSLKTSSWKRPSFLASMTLLCAITIARAVAVTLQNAQPKDEAADAVELLKEILTRFASHRKKKSNVIWHCRCFAIRVCGLSVLFATIGNSQAHRFIAAQPQRYRKMLVSGKLSIQTVKSCCWKSKAVFAFSVDTKTYLQVSHGNGLLTF